VKYHCGHRHSTLYDMKLLCNVKSRLHPWGLWVLCVKAFSSNYSVFCRDTSFFISFHSESHSRTLIALFFIIDLLSIFSLKWAPFRPTLLQELCITFIYSHCLSRGYYVKKHIHYIFWSQFKIIKLQSIRTTSNA
jgi:hypothetical protein